MISKEENNYCLEGFEQSDFVQPRGPRKGYSDERENTTEGRLGGVACHASMSMCHAVLVL